jgi:hypothetical protein
VAKGSFVGLIESMVLENRKFEEKRFAGSKAVKCIGYTTKMATCLYANLLEL